MSQMTTALILIVDGKLSCTFHVTDEAAAAAADKIPFEKGYTIASKDDLEKLFGEEQRLPGYQTLYDALMGDSKPKGEKPLRYLNDARDKCWTLLLSHLDGHPDFGVSEEEVEPKGDDGTAEPEAEVAAEPEPEPEPEKGQTVKSEVKKAPAAKPKAPAAKAKVPVKAPAVAAVKAKAPVAKAPVAKAAAKAPVAKKAAPAKPAAKAKAPAKKAAAKSNGVGRTSGPSPQWRALLADLGKSKNGLTRADMVALCGKHGVKPWWGRFVEKGFIERLDRGSYKLTDEGRAALA